MSVKAIEKLLDKVVFLLTEYNFQSMNSSINFFLRNQEIQNNWKSWSLSKLCWERIRFFHFEFKKGTEYDVILRDWRRWHWKVSYSSKLLLSRNFIYNKLKAMRKTQTPAQLNLVGHRMNSLPGHMSIWRRKQTESEMKLKKKIDIAKQTRTLKLFVNELLIKKDSFAI